MDLMGSSLEYGDSACGNPDLLPERVVPVRSFLSQSRIEVYWIGKRFARNMGQTGGDILINAGF